MNKLVCSKEAGPCSIWRAYATNRPSVLPRTYSIAQIGFIGRVCGSAAWVFSCPVPLRESPSSAPVCATLHLPQGEGLAGMIPPLLPMPWVISPNTATIRKRACFSGARPRRIPMPPGQTIAQGMVLCPWIKVRFYHKIARFLPQIALNSWRRHGSVPCLRAFQ